MPRYWDETRWPCHGQAIVSIKTSTMRLTWLIILLGPRQGPWWMGLLGTSVVKKHWAVMTIGWAPTYACTQDSFLRTIILQRMYSYTQSTNSCSAGLLSEVLLEKDSRAWRCDELPQVASAARQRYQREQRELFNWLTTTLSTKKLPTTTSFMLGPITTHSRNIANLEKTYDENGNGTIFTPKCCAFGG